MEYPSNANLAAKETPKQPEKIKVESVISGKAKTKPAKRNNVKNFIFAQDLKDVKDGIIQDVIRPKIQEWLYRVANDIAGTIDSTFQMMLWGNVRKTPGRTVGDKVSYNQCSSRPQSSAPSMTVAYNSADDITYESRGDADVVLASMKEHLQTYPYVTVAQMYEFSDLSAPNWTTNNFGWSDLTGVEVKRSFDGDYYIDLPRAKPLPK